MPAHYTCDKCGKEPANEDYDGLILCKLHRTENDLWYLKREYQTKKKWVDDVWISKLEKMEAEISELKRIIVGLNEK